MLLAHLIDLTFRREMNHVASEGQRRIVPHHTCTYTLTKFINKFVSVAHSSAKSKQTHVIK